MDKCCDRKTDREPDERREVIRDSLVFGKTTIVPGNRNK